MALRSTLAPILLVAFLVAASPAAAQATVMNAQCGDKDWHGEANEFGKICMRFQDSMMGAAIPTEARITLNHLYEDRDAAYFLVMFAAEGTPLKVSDVALTVDGEPIPIYKSEGETKLFIDIQDMPPAGKTMVLSGTVDSCDRGLYQIGALIQPFNYRWQKLVMANGEQADLFGFTQIGVNEASCKGGLPGLPKVDAPAGGLLASIAALGAVAYALRRR